MGRFNTHKYGAVRTGKYASKKEAKRAGELAFMRDLAIISDLEEQVKFEIIPACPPNRAAHYVADFCYVDCATGERITEDVKGYRTSEFVLKKKLMRYVHGIDIVEV